MFNFFVQLLFVSAAAGMQELDDVVPSCSLHAPIQSKQCLIQQQQLITAASQIKMVERHTPLGTNEVLLDVNEDPARISEEDFEMIDASEAFANEGFMMKEQKANWTGEGITMNFARSSPDMDTVTTKYMENWNFDPVTKNITTVTKPYLESLIPVKEGGQIVSDYSKDGVRMLGFNVSTSGLVNVASDRYWTAKPGTKRAFLIYVIQILNLPEISKWNYDVIFTTSSPQSLMMFPMGQVTKRTTAGHCYIVLVCNNEVECEDGSIKVSRVILSPQKEDMPKPDEVHPIMSNNSSNTSTMDNRSSGELANDVKSQATK